MSGTPTKHGLLALRERVRLATAVGGIAATAWWLLKVITHIEAHYVFAQFLDRTTCNCSWLSRQFELRAVRSVAAANEIDPDLRMQLEQHLPDGLTELCLKGGRIFFLIDDRSVVCQLLLNSGSRIHLDVPAGVTLDIGDQRAFVSYLHTDAGYRRMGAATALLQHVGSELLREGLRQVLAHIRTTNVPSLSVFRQSGWLRLGTLWTPTGGGWLGDSGLARHGIRASMTNSSR